MDSRSEWQGTKGQEDLAIVYLELAIVYLELAIVYLELAIIYLDLAIVVYLEWELRSQHWSRTSKNRGRTLLNSLESGRLRGVSLDFYVDDGTEETLSFIHTHNHYPDPKGLCFSLCGRRGVPIWLEAWYPFRTSVRITLFLTLKYAIGDQEITSISYWRSHTHIHT